MFSFSTHTAGQGLYEITSQVRSQLAELNVETGILTLFIQHTSASLLIQENADPTVLADLKDFFSRIAPEACAYAHDAEGPDDMPAHIKSALTATSLSIPVIDGQIALGTWQGIYIFEHRRVPHKRRVVGGVARG